jgi:hypothetical protein
MLFTNPTDQEIRVKIGTGFTVKPGVVIEIEAGIATPRLYSNGARRPSILEQLAPGLVPSDEADRMQWLKAPDYKPSTPTNSLPTVDSLVLQGIPRGVAIATVRAALEQKTAELDAAESSNHFISSTSDGKKKKAV